MSRALGANGTNMKVIFGKNGLCGQPGPRKMDGCLKDRRLWAY